ncbi:TPA: hypothetical protein ACGXQD_005834 [Bacillus cereus]
MFKRTIIRGMQVILTFTFLFGFAFLSTTSASAEEMDVTNIYFMQDTANNAGTHSTTGKTYTVLDNAIALKKGERLRPTDFPPIRVYGDPNGKIWTLDHRRLITFKLAGIDTINVIRVTKEVYENEKPFKHSTTNEGESITLLSSNGSKPIIVKRNERYKWTIDTLKKNKDKF